ncbi:uncharacterized protein N7458_007959 [Penicillium daleae]|uniref:Uncharacterized protein n=1 Tax=Penicillium daleae TaxID=63821 RepID=A0AAD6G0F3_9EURO|nr:uncharacterized protein N7458_007959 [Penicillium daleae]KAJ5444087.1 hypothetical protein N7458_007959 [Penicillium daleae]
MNLLFSDALLFLSSATATVLSVVSFVFTIIALTSPDWATQAQYDVDPFHPSINTRNLSAVVSRGPRKQCTFQRNETDPAAPWFTTCDPGGCQAGDLAWWCQQQDVGSNLLVAGCVLAGVACVYAMLALAAMLPLLPGSEPGANGESGAECTRRVRAPAWRHRLSSWRHPDQEQRLGFVLARGFLSMMLVLSIATFAIGTLVLSELLVNQQPPDSDFISSAPSVITSDHWMIGKAVIYANLGWLPNLVAWLCLPSVEMVFVRSHRRHEESRRHIVNVRKGGRTNVA